jgi:phosphoserine phosphatase
MVAPVAEVMGFDNVACIELKTIDGTYTGGIVDHCCSRDCKLQRGQDDCQQHNLDFNDAMYYGDSLSEIRFLEKFAGL